MTTPTIVEISLDTTLIAERQEVALNGEKFHIETRYNYRGAYWTMSIYNAAKELILGGLKMVANWPICYASDYIETLPKGTFILLDMSGDNREAGQDDLSNRCRLIFIEELLGISISDVIDALRKQGVRTDTGV